MWPATVQRWVWQHPERVPAIVVGSAWLMLMAREGVGISHMGHPGAASCFGGCGAPFARVLGNWLLMTVAMMGPASLAGLRHTATSSLRWRRGRAMLEFAGMYLVVWTAFGAMAIGLISAVGPPSWFRLTVCLAAGAIWQMTA